MTDADNFGHRPRFMDPLSDFGFKKLFGSEVNKEILIAFLKVIFPEYEIEDITYVTPEQMGVSPQDRKAIFDILCRCSDGKMFLVEMQKSGQRHFYERALFYTAYPLIAQGRKGMQDEDEDDDDNEVNDDEKEMGDRKEKGNEREKERRPWDFSLDGVFFLGIMNFVLEKDDKIIHRYMLKETETGQMMTDKLQFVFIELPKFRKTESELETMTDKWFFLLRNLPRLLDRPVALRDRIFSRIFDVVDFKSLDINDQLNYDFRMETWRDIELQRQYAREQGVEEGLAKGISEGMVKGMENARMTIAANLLRIGTPVETIAKATGLSTDEVLAISI